MLQLPYKNRNEKLAYNKGFYAGCRYITIQHLGGKCVVCGETDLYELEIHHINELRRKARSEQDLKDLSQLEVRCKEHHSRKKYY